MEPGRGDGHECLMSLQDKIRTSIEPCPVHSSLGTGGGLTSGASQSPHHQDAEELACAKNVGTHKAWPEEGGRQQGATESPPR